MISYIYLINIYTKPKHFQPTTEITTVVAGLMRLIITAWRATRRRIQRSLISELYWHIYTNLHTYTLPQPHEHDTYIFIVFIVILYPCNHTLLYRYQMQVYMERVTYISISKSLNGYLSCMGNLEFKSYQLLKINYVYNS